MPPVITLSLLPLVLTPPGLTADAETLAVVPKTKVFERVAARVRQTPIYEWEVRQEAMFQAGFRRPPGWALPDAADRQADLRALRDLIHRELVIEAALARLRSLQKPPDELFQAAREETERIFNQIEAANHMPISEVLAPWKPHGVTVERARRRFEREFIRRIYLADHCRVAVQGITPDEIRKYYGDHLDEFRTADWVKWQNLFVRNDRFASEEEAYHHARSLMRRARCEDFVKLVAQYDQGTSAANDGYGYGEKRGQINPRDLEDAIFEMKTGEIKLFEFGTGYHIVRIAERGYPRLRPLDEVEKEIRHKLEQQIIFAICDQLYDSLWEDAKHEMAIRKDADGFEAEADSRWRLALANWTDAGREGLSEMCLSCGGLLTVRDLCDHAADLLARGDAKQAIAICQEAINLGPGCAAAYRIRGRACRQVKDDEQALADFGRAIELNPADKQARFERARLCLDGEQFNQAIQDLGLLIDSDAGDRCALVLRAVCYLRQGYPDNAAADCTQALKERPNDVRALAIRGDAKAFKGEYACAAEDFSAALRAYPGIPHLLVRRAGCHFQRAEFRECIDDYREALRFDPNQREALTDLAIVLSSVPDPELRDGWEALQYARRACQITRWRDADRLATLAAAYAECGNYKLARRWENKALEIGFTDHEADRRSVQRLKLFEEGKPFRLLPVEK